MLNKEGLLFYIPTGQENAVFVLSPSDSTAKKLLENYELNRLPKFL